MISKRSRQRSGIGLDLIAEAAAAAHKAGLLAESGAVRAPAP